MSVRLSREQRIMAAAVIMRDAVEEMQLDERTKNSGRGALGKPAGVSGTTGRGTVGTAAPTRTAVA